MLTSFTRRADVRLFGAMAILVGLTTAVQGSITITNDSDNDPLNGIKLSDLTVGGTFQANDKVFEDWQFTVYDPIGGASQPDPDDIDIMPLDTPLSEGFMFVSNGEFATTQGQRQSALLTYTVRNVTGAATIKDVQLTVDQFTATFPGDINLNEDVEDADGNDLAFPGIDLILDDTDTPPVTAGLEFEPQSQITVKKFMAVIDNATLDKMTQRVSQVPEPTTIVMWLVLGVAGLVMLRRARRAV